jgi:cephalosporin-C deacetylase
MAQRGGRSQERTGLPVHVSGRAPVKRSAAARAVVVLVVLTACTGALAQEIIATPSKPLGVYALGEPIAWSVEVRGEGAAQVSELHYVLKKNGLSVMREGVLPLTDGKGTLEATLGEPGTILAELKAKVGDKEITADAGAAVDPMALAPSVPRPNDFDEFWKAKLAELEAVPASPVLEAADSGRDDVEYYKIRMDNIRGTHVYGQLAKPKREGELPALLIVQWAGVYPLDRDWVTWQAQSGWLTLNIEAHDLPFDQPEGFYDNLSKTTLAHYPAIGNDDRETSYFLRMYLSCYRAAEYLSQRPDWDGRTLVVMGGSQGGLQTIVTAALHPKVTAAIASVPAGCDLNGPEAGRECGWPHWYWAAEGKDENKVHQASRYYDVVNFASRVTCPTLVGLGLVDTTCPAPGVFAMTNQLKGPKEVVVMPAAGHNDGPHDAFDAREKAWLEAMVMGKPAPVEGK